MPKKVQFDFVVPGEPRQVSERLSTKTRKRLFPHQTSMLGKGELGGRVSEEGFTVSEDPRSFFRTLVPVASGELVDRGDGSTRVRGIAGMPDWVAWSLRVGFLSVPAFALFSIASILLSGGDVSLSASFAGLMAMMLTFAVATIGWQVNKADEGLEPLVDKLRDATGAVSDEPPPTHREPELASLDAATRARRMRERIKAQKH